MIKKIFLLFILLIAFNVNNAQDAPVDYTPYIGLRLFAQGATPTADSLNRNMLDLDAAIYNKNLRIDTIKQALAAIYMTANTWTAPQIINNLSVGQFYSPTRNIIDSLIRCDSSSTFSKTLSGSTQRLILYNMVVGQTIRIELTATGSTQVIWVSTILWPNGATPTQTTGGTDVYYITKTSNTKYIGYYFQNYGTGITVTIPDAPTLNTPANTATGVALNPLLTWFPVNGATSYNFQLDDSVSFTAVKLYNVTGLTQTQYQIPAGLLVNTTYYWRVYAVNSAGTSVASSIRSFTTLNTPSAPSIVYYDVPAQWQLYARDSQDSAVVPIVGQLQTSSYDTIYVEMYRSNVLKKRLAQKLNYGGGSTANFSFNPKIKAELNEYKFLVYAKYSSTSVLAKTIDSVVAGDGYIIMGQSNAQASSTSETYSNEYCRTFGVQTASENSNNYSAGDTLWAKSSANYTYTGGLTANKTVNVGVWGMEIQRLIKENDSIPTCVINGSKHSTSILAHLRNDTNQTDFTTYYGKTLYRAQKSHLAASIKGLFWYQGELNIDTSYSSYASRFASLYADWKDNYPALTKIYVFQIRPLGCYTGANFGMELREIQRNFMETYSDVQVISTAGVPGYGAGGASQNCHYEVTGYQWMAAMIYRNMAPFYNNSDTINCRPPNIRRAFFTSGKDSIRIVFDNSQPVAFPADSLGLSIQDYFYLNGVPGYTSGIDTGAWVNDTLILKLTGASNASRISYIPPTYTSNGTTIYTGPWIRNNKGIGALTFNKVLIYEYESVALFTRMPTIDTYNYYKTPLPIPRTVLMDSLIKKYKSHGVWSKWDVLYILANRDTGMANLNWVSGKADSFRCIPNNGIVFNVDRGYTGDSVSMYLNTQFRPSVSGVKFTATNGSVAIMNHTNYYRNWGSTYDKLSWKLFGTWSSGNSFFDMVAHSSYSGFPDRLWCNINDGNGTWATNFNAIGFYIITRGGSATTDLTIYKDWNTGSKTGPTFSNTGTASDKPVYIFAINLNGTADQFAPVRQSIFAIGEHLLDADAINFTADTKWYLTYVGAM